MFFTYMLRCEDNSVYTGITNNVEDRLNKHLSGLGAKYTRSHGVVGVEAVWRCKDKPLACKLEYQIKQLTKQETERLIAGERLSHFFGGKLDCRRYYRVG